MRIIISTVLVLACACAGHETASPPITETDVQHLVSQYMAAQNAGDATASMGLFSHEPGVISAGNGEIARGWDAIRQSTDSSIAQAATFQITTGTIDVQLLGDDAALATMPFHLSPRRADGGPQIDGALTLAVHREPEGLRIVQEHSSYTPQSLVAYLRWLRPVG